MATWALLGAVIPRFVAGLIDHLTPDWPDSPDQYGAHPVFERREPYRKFRVLIDAHLLAGAEPFAAMPTVKEVLTALLKSPNVQYWRYADDGPDAHAPSRSVRGHSVIDGWVVVNEREDVGWLVSYPTGPGRSTTSGVIGDAVDFAVQDWNTDAYRDLSPAEARARHRSDCLAAQVAQQAVTADLFITERPYVHAAKWLRSELLFAARGHACADQFVFAKSG